MKKSMIAAAVVASVITAPVMASESQDSNFFWGNVYGDYVNNGGLLTDNDLASNDAVVIGMEGGVIGSGFNIYGFVEQDLTNDNTFTKMTTHVDVVGNFTLYAQGTQFHTQTDYTESNIAVGVGYKGLKTDNFNLTPWVGVNHNADTKDEDLMIGWSGMYNFNSNLYLTHWNEVKFKDSDTTNFGGDFGIYHKLPMNMYAGIQYRYNSHHSVTQKYDDNIGIRVGMSL